MLLFEIIPVYKWNFADLKKAKQDKDFISYEEFMKNYKPYSVTVINKETAFQWLQETSKILQFIEINDGKGPELS